LDRRTWNLSFRLIAISALLVIAGLWLRFDAPIAPYLRDAFGGITYVLFFVLVVGAVIPNGSSTSIAAVVLFATCCLEFLQLWHPAWLEAYRGTLAGRLLLGTTFEWTDFLPYFIGAVLGWALLRTLRKR
jgi:hypothetical protein